MKPTVEYIKQKFDEYNQLMFEGKLSPLPFKLSSARTFLGQITYYRDKNPDGTWHYRNFVFKISTLIDMDENIVEDTIIHEMIHYYILSNQMQDTGPHGDLFKKIMKDINVRFDRNISIVHQSTKEEQDRDTEVREHYVCVVRLRTNKMYIAVVAKNKILQLWDEIPNLPKVAECNWYLSNNPYFNRFPRVTSASRLYPVVRLEIEEHIKDAKILERRGNNIMVKKQ